MRIRSGGEPILDNLETFERIVDEFGVLIPAGSERRKLLDELCGKRALLVLLHVFESSASFVTLAASRLSPVPTRARPSLPSNIGRQYSTPLPVS